jgi:hypothetical protein
MTLQPDPETLGSWTDPQCRAGSPATFAVVIGVSQPTSLRRLDFTPCQQQVDEAAP